MTDEPQYDFFVSYSREGKSWAEWIAWHLEEAGFSTQLQSWHFVPGSDFVQEMNAAARRCTKTICVLTPSYAESEFASAEWVAAFAKDPTGKRRSLIPVRTADVQIPDLLQTRVYIDLVGLDKERAREVLIQGVTAGGMKPTAPPAFPNDASTIAFPPSESPHAAAGLLTTAGWQRIILRHDDSADFDLSQYSSIGDLLDDLWVFYLYNDFPAFTYGSRWVLATPELALAPLAWAGAEPQPIRDRFPEWQEFRLEDLGLAPGLSDAPWRVTPVGQQGFVGIKMPSAESAARLRNDRKRLIATRMDVERGHGKLASALPRDPGLVLLVDKPALSGRILRGEDGYPVLS